MPDLDQRIADGLRLLVARDRGSRRVAGHREIRREQHRRRRRTIAGAVVAVRLLAGALATVGVLRGGGSKVVVSEPGPTTTEPQPTGPQPTAPSGATLTATGPIDGSFAITAGPSLEFTPRAVTVTTGIYAITLVDSSTGAHMLNFDDPTTRWSAVIVQADGETQTTWIFFGKPVIYRCQSTRSPATGPPGCRGP